MFKDFFIPPIYYFHDHGNIVFFFLVEKLKWALINWKLKNTSDFRYEFTIAVMVQEIQQWNTSIVWRYSVIKWEDYDHRITCCGSQNEILTRTTEFIFLHPPPEEPGQFHPQSLQDRCWCYTYSEHLRNMGDKINYGDCTDSTAYWSKPAQDLIYKI